MTEPDVKPKAPLLRDGKVHLTAFVAGFIVATAMAYMGGTSVAWATPVYYVLGWPVMCAMVYWLARRFPYNAWRWTLSMMLGQVFSSIFFGNASFVLQAMLFVTLLSAPQFVAGVFGARAGAAREDSTPQDPL
ncbi:MAG: hypothetical protein CMQ34_06050 [Gammaproteobacteria bacterium]|nr:hypothetical protein [Gammaproteobacteria bacterium]|tara:strand:+ start:826 stop:1224 length:399 start_codon:yes stop_codon:yes gene_type:complete